MVCDCRDGGLVRLLPGQSVASVVPMDPPGGAQRAHVELAVPIFDAACEFLLVGAVDFELRLSIDDGLAFASAR